MRRIFIQIEIVILIFLFFGCNNTLTQSNTISDENSSETELSSNGKYISVEPDEAGVKIKIAQNVQLKQWGGSSISIENSPLFISLDAGDNSVKEFIYPFVTKGDTVIVKLQASLNIDGGEIYTDVTEEVACVAGGGIDITDYIDCDSIKNSKTDVTYSSNLGFVGNYTINTTNIILDSSIFEFATIAYNLMIGESDWTYSKYFALCKVSDLLINDFQLNNSFTYTNTPEYSEWEKYYFKYVAYATAEFRLKDCPNTLFRLGNIYSQEKICTETDSILCDFKEFKINNNWHISCFNECKRAVTIKNVTDNSITFTVNYPINPVGLERMVQIVYGDDDYKQDKQYSCSYEIKGPCENEMNVCWWVTKYQGNIISSYNDYSFTAYSLQINCDSTSNGGILFFPTEIGDYTIQKVLVTEN